ncbi:MAG: hypothetical protein ACUVTH_14260 [Thermogutta sp.]
MPKRSEASFHLPYQDQKVGNFEVAPLLHLQLGGLQCRIRPWVDGESPLA